MIARMRLLGVMILMSGTIFARGKVAEYTPAEEIAIEARSPEAVRAATRRRGMERQQARQQARTGVKGSVAQETYSTIPAKMPREDGEQPQLVAIDDEAAEKARAHDEVLQLQAAIDEHNDRLAKLQEQLVIATKKAPKGGVAARLKREIAREKKAIQQKEFILDVLKSGETPFASEKAVAGEEDAARRYAAALEAQKRYRYERKGDIEVSVAKYQRIAASQERASELGGGRGLITRGAAGKGRAMGTAEKAAQRRGKIPTARPMAQPQVRRRDVQQPAPHDLTATMTSDVQR